MSNPQRNKPDRLPHLFKGILRSLGIAASTASIVEILRNQYSIGISAALSWLLITVALKRMYKGQ